MPKRLVAVAWVAFALLVLGLLVVAGRWLVETIVLKDDTSTCLTSKFEIENQSARTEGMRIVVTASVRNRNSVACGVQVSVAAKDKAGKQVAIEQLWVAGVSNIPAGANQVFPVYLTPEVSKDAEGGDFDIQPINSRVWKQQ